MVEPCGVWIDESGTVVLRRFRVALAPAGGGKLRQTLTNSGRAALEAAANGGSSGSTPPSSTSPGDALEWREVTHYQYTGWPDHGVPSSTKPFLRLLRDVARVERSLLDTAVVALPSQVPLHSTFSFISLTHTHTHYCILVTANCCSL